MPKYEIEFSYKIPEWGFINLEANDLEQAEEFALEQINELYSHVDDIEINGIKELG